MAHTVSNSPESMQPSKSRIESATRLYAILARRGQTGVVFRRGPSKQVQLLRWDLSNDRIDHGQWFNGRIYERRCDLSPSGEFLVYLAAKYPSHFGAWSAVSRPPYFTALALWPKLRGTYGGGGLFESETELHLNHGVEEFALAEGFRLKVGMTVEPFGSHSGGGEDEPILSARRRRDGWTLSDPGKTEGLSSRREGYYWRIDPPQIWRKKAAGGRRLEERLHAVARSNHPWYDTSFRVLDEAGAPLFELAQTDWADWHGNDLVFARDGRLFRLNHRNFYRYLAHGEEALRLIGDFNATRFTPVLAPGNARRW